MRYMEGKWSSVPLRNGTRTTSDHGTGDDVDDYDYDDDTEINLQCIYP